MSLLYKEDWEYTKERYKAWWAGEYTGRCLIWAQAPKTGVQINAPKLPERVEDRWLDYDYLHQLNEYNMQSTVYAGESFPLYNPGFPGWAQMSAYIGDGKQIVLKEETSWRETLLHNGSLNDYTVSDLKANPDNKWLKKAYEMQQFVMKEAEGKSVPAVMTHINPGDDLADLRGTQNLLYDTLDYPELVLEYDQFLVKEAMAIYDEFYNVIKESDEGNSTWFKIWAPGKNGIIQNDFSYMISTQMFEELFLPTIEMLTNFYDYSCYHVDGEGSFKHVDLLCQLPRLKTLQILPGAGKPSPLHYIDVLRKVQSAGKNLHIGIPPEQIEEALGMLSAKGLFIDTQFKTQEEAEYVLKNLEKWSKVR